MAMPMTIIIQLFIDCVLVEREFLLACVCYLVVALLFFYHVGVYEVVPVIVEVAIGFVA